MNLNPPACDTFYFVGVTTGRSSIMTVFPRWAEALGLGPVPIAGIDCRLHDEPEAYRAVVSFLKREPHALGALVTTHKIDLLSAARDLFDDLGPHAALLGEVSSISKRDGRLWGHAKDPITSGLSLEAIVDPAYWRRTGADLVLLGAGGSSLALTTWLMERSDPAAWPARLRVTNRSPARLEHMRRLHARINPGIPVSYHLCPAARDNDAVVAAARPGSLIVNATGLGKDAPGSPLTDAAQWPENAVAWDFNYRGDLVFLAQARAAAAARHLRIEDGWVYFLHGWTRVIAEVFHIDIPTSGPTFDELARLAGEARG